MFLSKDHPLILKHDSFITSLMQELPFSSWSDAVTFAKAEASLLDCEYIILYPQEKHDVLQAICDHITQKTDDYMEAHKEDYKGVKNILKNLIIYQLKLYPNMPLIFKKLFPKILIGGGLISHTKAFYAVINHLWRMAGDSATDYNYYSKRFLLGNIYLETIFFAVQDESPALYNTSLYIDRAFEKIKYIEILKTKLPDIDLLQEKIFSAFGSLRFKKSSVKST